MRPTDTQGHDAAPSSDDLAAIRTTPGLTGAGKPFDEYVMREVAAVKLRLELVPADVLGLKRPLEIYRATRKGNIIKPWTMPPGSEDYCPAHWADLAIGRGACGLRCRACFLILTHRAMCDPSRHTVYENTDDYEIAVRKWLQRPDRSTLGLGTDCSDSFLYEGVTGHARRLIPLFASDETNPRRCKLLLLTKSTNVHYLRGLATRNVVVSFSLNPEPIADLWEGKFNDGTRVTPSTDERLAAAKTAADMGFEVRWRIDPILDVPDWEDTYRQFIHAAAEDGHKPTRITLGTYREMQPTLTLFAERWGLPPMEWKPPKLARDGPHHHVGERARIYSVLTDAIRQAWAGTGHQPITALCKEPRRVRQACGLDHEQCNCG